MIRTARSALLISRLPIALCVLAAAGLIGLRSAVLAEPAQSPIKIAANDKARKPNTKQAPKPQAKAAPRGTPAAAKPTAKITAKTPVKPATKTSTKPLPKALAKTTAHPLPPKRPAASGRPQPAGASPVEAALEATNAPGADGPGHHTRPIALPAPATTIVTTAAIDVAALKRAIDLVRARKQSDATEVRSTISDPVARKLLEWVILRSDDPGADLDRFIAFITANPTWPSLVTLRRKAEAAAWQGPANPATVRQFFRQMPPLSAKGRLALARALLAAGDRASAEALVRETWRNDSFSEDVEGLVQQQFQEFLTRADDKARMDRRLYEKDDTDAGLRAAQRLGGYEPAIAKARIALLERSAGTAALDAVPAAARNDIGYKFARLQMLRRGDHLAEAVTLLHSIPKLDESHDTDEWWVERRLIARMLLDVGDARNAYLVVRDATPPARDSYRAEHEFMAGWIALRFLHDPNTAYAHFAKVAEVNDNPISIARGAYWMGRAAEAMRNERQALQHYQDAARYPTAYYGQLARAKAGLGELTLNPFPALSHQQRAKATGSDLVRAVELLYAIDARDLAWTMLADVGDKSTDLSTLAVLSELTAKYHDARGMLLLGKLALARGYALEHAAFPVIGLPNYKPVGPPVELAIVYSIARQESWFNPKTISSAHALGLMQVTPVAGRHIAKKFNVAFDQKRLLSDQAYNVQIGAAALGDVIKDYRGSYIMAFAAYNAGSGRVREWVGRFGDPRDPRIDPIDWVERIPFSETRNYVQRIMENVQVYRVRFGGTPRLLIEADLHRGSAAN